MVRIKYKCFYCGEIFSIYLYSIDTPDERCKKCNEVMTVKNILKEEDTDIFGYNKVKKDNK